MYVTKWVSEWGEWVSQPFSLFIKCLNSWYDKEAETTDNLNNLMSKYILK